MTGRADGALQHARLTPDVRLTAGAGTAISAPEPGTGRPISLCETSRTIGWPRGLTYIDTTTEAHVQTELFELWVRNQAGGKFELFQTYLTAEQVRSWTRWMNPDSFTVYSYRTGGDVTHLF